MVMPFWSVANLRVVHVLHFKLLRVLCSNGSVKFALQCFVEFDVGFVSAAMKFRFILSSDKDSGEKICVQL